MQQSQYDIIGDIHGRADLLIEMLEKLGYQENADGVYCHPEGRQAVFVGDFINKGSSSKAVVDIIRPMVEAGHAQAVMGNHELCEIMKHRDQENAPKRLVDQQTEFRSFFDGEAEYKTAVDWFKKLPLYLELGDVGVVHAVWDDDVFATLKPFLKDDKVLSEGIYEEYTNPHSRYRNALKKALVGQQALLPKGESFQTSTGATRTHVNVPHFLEDKQLATYLEILGAGSTLKPTFQATTQKDMCFLGHFSFPAAMIDALVYSEGAHCLDFTGESLVAYRHHGEAGFDPRNLVSVGEVEAALKNELGSPSPSNHQ